jgi:hypothetical protein
MTSAEHVSMELGAHALGLLDEHEARAVNQHLAGCAACRREWEELREMTNLLGELPPEAFLDGPPDADMMLQRTLRQVRTETGARRRRRRFVLVAAAAAVAAVVLGGGITVGRLTAPDTTVVAQAPGTIAVEGTGPGGVAMRAAVSPAANWVRLTANVKGIPTGEHCRLLVIAKDGTREIAGSWIVGPTGEATGVTLNGSAAVAIGDVAAIAVENTAGREFVQVNT